MNGQIALDQFATLPKVCIASFSTGFQILNVEDFTTTSLWRLAWLCDWFRPRSCEEEWQMSLPFQRSPLLVSTLHPSYSDPWSTTSRSCLRRQVHQPGCLTDTLSRAPQPTCDGPMKLEQGINFDEVTGTGRLLVVVAQFRLSCLTKVSTFKHGPRLRIASQVGKFSLN